MSPSLQDEFGSDSEDDDNSSEFLNFMFKFLLDSHESRSKAIRFRVCQMVNKLLTNMDDNASIDDELADAIFDAMFVRLQDKIPAVRAQAVAALCRLQDPSDSECPIITAYLQLMSCDSSPDVRRAVLLRIAVTPKTLPSIIGEWNREKSRKREERKKNKGKLGSRERNTIE